MPSTRIEVAERANTGSRVAAVPQTTADYQRRRAHQGGELRCARRTERGCHIPSPYFDHPTSPPLTALTGGTDGTNCRHQAVFAALCAADPDVMDRDDIAGF